MISIYQEVLKRHSLWTEGIRVYDEESRRGGVGVPSMEERCGHGVPGSQRGSAEVESEENLPRVP